MAEVPDSDRAYQRDIYRYVEEIVGGLSEEDDYSLSGRLEEAYGIDFYPIEKDFEKGNHYMRASFGLSALLAEEYSVPEDPFFDNRAEDFSAFIDELGERGSGYHKTHLVQYAQLYSAVAEKEGIDFDHPTDALVLESIGDARGLVIDMFEDLKSSV